MSKDNSVLKNKGGRPRSEEKDLRSRRIVFLVNPMEYLRIKNHAKQARLTVASYVRRTALQEQVKAAVSASLNAAMRDIEGLCNNVNQLAHYANTIKSIEPIAPQLSSVLQKAHEVLDSISRRL